MSSQKNPSDVEEAEEFDPYKERQVEVPTSKFETLMNLVKSNVGTGIFSFPLAFGYTGLLTGTFMTFITAAIITHGMFMVLNCSYILCQRLKKPSMRYSELVEAACLNGPAWSHRLATPMRRFTNFIFGLGYFGICSVYTVIVAENLEQVVEFTVGVKYDIRIYIACLLLPLILICCIPHLKYLAPVSILANILMLTGIVITFYYCFTDMPSLAERPMYTSITNVPAFFGVAFFALVSTGEILPFENQMKNPAQMRGKFGVVSIAMCFFAILYSFMGFIGFARYGDDIKGSITLNLPIEETAARTVKVLVSIAIFFTTALVFYVLLETLWIPIKHKFTKHPTIANYILRVFLASAAVLLAVAVPTIGPFIELVGAFGFSFIGLLLPAFMETLTYYDRGYGKFKWRILKNGLITAVGIMAFLLGTIDALHSISKLYTNESQ